MSSISRFRPDKGPANEPRIRALRLAAWVVTVAILALTLSPAALAPQTGIDHADKVFHAVAFFVWALLVTGGWRWPGWLIVVVAAVFGGAIEIVQPLSGRDAELADMAADLVGAGAGIWAGLRLRAGGRRA